MARREEMAAEIKALIKANPKITDQEILQKVGTKFGTGSILGGVASQAAFGEIEPPPITDIPAILGGLAGAALPEAKLLPHLGRIGRIVAPMAGAIAGGEAGRLGTQAVTGQLPKSGSELASSMTEEAERQILMQALPSLMRGGGEVLKLNQARARVRGWRQYRDAVRARRDAGDITKELASDMERTALEAFKAGASTKDFRVAVSQLVKQAGGELKIAGQAVRGALSTSPEKVTLGEVLNQATSDWESQFPNPMSPQARKEFMQEARRRIQVVIRGYTEGAIPEKKLAFDPLEANEVKRAFQKQSRAVFGQSERGIEPRTSMDRTLAGAWRKIIEQKVPNIAELNKASQSAALSFQALKGTEAKLAHPAVAELKLGTAEKSVIERSKVRTEAAIRRAEARRRASERVDFTRFQQARKDNPLAFRRPVPGAGTLGIPAAVIKEGRVSELGGRLGDVLTNPWLLWPALIGPRLLAIQSELSQRKPR